MSHTHCDQRALSPAIHYRRAVDWSLLKCARKGHVTYAPDESALRDRLHVATPAGEAWRCLRCGTYVHGEPDGRVPPISPARHARPGAARRAVIRFFASSG